MIQDRIMTTFLLHVEHIYVYKLKGMQGFDFYLRMYFLLLFKSRLKGI